MDTVDEMLVALKAQREKLAQEMERVEKAIAALEGSLEGPPAAPKLPYVYMTVYEAAAHYLVHAGEPRTTRQIADALRAGGFKTRSRRFASTVSTMLGRPDARQAGIRRTADGKRWFCKR